MNPQDILKNWTVSPNPAVIGDHLEKMLTSASKDATAWAKNHGIPYAEMQYFFKAINEAKKEMCRIRNVAVKQWLVKTRSEGKQSYAEILQHRIKKLKLSEYELAKLAQVPLYDIECLLQEKPVSATTINAIEQVLEAVADSLGV